MPKPNDTQHRSSSSAYFDSDPAFDEEAIAAAEAADDLERLAHSAEAAQRRARLMSSSAPTAHGGGSAIIRSSHTRSSNRLLDRSQESAGEDEEDDLGIPQTALEVFRNERLPSYLQRLLATNGIRGEPVAYLQVLVPERFEGSRIPVYRGYNVIGREAISDAYIAFDEVGVSGNHALIEVSNDGAEHFVEDLFSTNGVQLGPTSYNLRAGRMYQLVHNKVIAFGPVSVRYEFADPLRAVAPLGTESAVGMDVDQPDRVIVDGWREMKGDESILGEYTMKLNPSVRAEAAPTRSILLAKDSQASDSQDTGLSAVSAAIRRPRAILEESDEEDESIPQNLTTNAPAAFISHATPMVRNAPELDDQDATDDEDAGNDVSRVRGAQQHLDQSSLKTPTPAKRGGRAGSSSSLHRTPGSEHGLHWKVIGLGSASLSYSGPPTQFAPITVDPTQVLQQSDQNEPPLRSPTRVRFDTTMMEPTLPVNRAIEGDSISTTRSGSTTARNNSMLAPTLESEHSSANSTGVFEHAPVDPTLALNPLVDATLVTDHPLSPTLDLRGGEESPSSDRPMVSPTLRIPGGGVAEPTLAIPGMLEPTIAIHSARNVTAEPTLSMGAVDQTLAITNSRFSAVQPTLAVNSTGPTLAVGSGAVEPTLFVEQRTGNVAPTLIQGDSGSTLAFQNDPTPVESTLRVGNAPNPRLSKTDSASTASGMHQSGVVAQSLAQRESMGEVVPPTPPSVRRPGSILSRMSKYSFEDDEEDETKHEEEAHANAPGLFTLLVEDTAVDDDEDDKQPLDADGKRGSGAEEQIAETQDDADADERVGMLPLSSEAPSQRLLFNAPTLLQLPQSHSLAGVKGPSASGGISTWNTTGGIGLSGAPAEDEPASPGDDIAAAPTLAIGELMSDTDDMDDAPESPQLMGVDESFGAALPALDAQRDIPELGQGKENVDGVEPDEDKAIGNKKLGERPEFAVRGRRKSQRKYGGRARRASRKVVQDLETEDEHEVEEGKPTGPAIEEERPEGVEAESGEQSEPPAPPVSNRYKVHPKRKGTKSAFLESSDSEEFPESIPPGAAPVMSISDQLIITPKASTSRSSAVLAHAESDTEEEDANKRAERVEEQQKEPTPAGRGVKRHALTRGKRGARGGANRGRSKGMQMNAQTKDSEDSGADVADESSTKPAEQNKVSVSGDSTLNLTDTPVETPLDVPGKRATRSTLASSNKAPGVTMDKTPTSSGKSKLTKKTLFSTDSDSDSDLMDPVDYSSDSGLLDSPPKWLSGRNKVFKPEDQDGVTNKHPNTPSTAKAKALNPPESIRVLQSAIKRKASAPGIDDVSNTERKKLRFDVDDSFTDANETSYIGSSELRVIGDDATLSQTPLRKMLTPMTISDDSMVVDSPGQFSEDRGTVDGQEATPGPPADDETSTIGKRKARGAEATPSRKIQEGQSEEQATNAGDEVSSEVGVSKAKRVVATRRRKSQSDQLQGAKEDEPVTAQSPMPPPTKRAGPKRKGKVAEITASSITATATPDTKAQSPEPLTVTVDKRRRKSKIAAASPQNSRSATPTFDTPAQSPRNSVAGSPANLTILGSGTKSLAPVRIMFTGLGEDVSKRRLIEALGGSIVDSWAECTHLVTDRIRRTMKFLCALSTAKHIVSVKWLDACKREAAFADEGKYMLNDKNSEKQYGFSLSKSLREARTLMESATDGDEQPPRLLTGVKIYATPSVQPPANELKEIVHAAGGELVATIPASTQDNPNDPVIIGDNKDIDACEKLAAQGWNIHNKEFLLTGILRQAVDYSSHIMISGSKGTTATQAQKKRKR